MDTPTLLSQARRCRDRIAEVEAEHARLRASNHVIAAELLAAGLSIRRVAQVTGIKQTEVWNLRRLVFARKRGELDHPRNLRLDARRG